MGELGPGESEQECATSASDFGSSSKKTVIEATSGLEISGKIQSQFCDKIRKCSRNFANRRAALCCQRCSKTKYEPTILVLKETAENGE